MARRPSIARNCGHNNAGGIACKGDWFVSIEEWKGLCVFVENRKVAVVVSPPSWDGGDAIVKMRDVEEKREDEEDEDEDEDEESL